MTLREGDTVKKAVYVSVWITQISAMWMCRLRETVVQIPKLKFYIG